MTPENRKIPANCKVCGNSLSRTDMMFFLDNCTKIGVAPIEEAFKRDPPGVSCFRCWCMAINDANEEHSTVGEILKRIGNHAKARAHGMRVVKGGKD